MSEDCRSSICCPPNDFEYSAQEVCPTGMSTTSALAAGDSEVADFYTGEIGTAVPRHLRPGSGYTVRIAITQNPRASLGHTLWYNKILTLREVQTLAGSRVKRLPLTIQPSTLGLYLPLDQFADRFAATGTNALKNLSTAAPGAGPRAIRIGYTPFGSPICESEQVQSYPPNE